MKKAILIKIGNYKFLLPDSHADYNFPSYILEHKQKIFELCYAYEKNMENMLDICKQKEYPDLKEFREKTGIIGCPFDMRDTELYALDKKIQITLEVDL
jgi:hypothetical protein